MTRRVRVLAWPSREGLSNMGDIHVVKPKPPKRRRPLGPVGRLGIVLGLGTAFALTLHFIGFSAAAIVAFASLLIGVLAAKSWRDKD